MAFRACGCHPTKGFVLTHAVELLGMGDRSRKRHSLSRGFRLVACSCGHLAFFGIEFVLRCGSNSQVEVQVQSGSKHLFGQVQNAAVVTGLVVSGGFTAAHSLFKNIHQFTLHAHAVGW